VAPLAPERLEERLMASVKLQFEERVLKEWPADLMLTIGRLPDNDVVIDNPAVSSHHACIFRDGADWVIEDLDSKNGTFVNGKRTARQVLQHGDVLLVGKHTLLFDQHAAGAPATEEKGPSLPALGDTIYLDTSQHRVLLSTMGEGADGAAAHARATEPAVLRVVKGKLDSDEYPLTARTSLVGKAECAAVRLRGWFKPKVAIAVARNADGYVVTPLGAKAFVNGNQVRQRQRLRSGDTLLVSGVTFEFHQPGNGNGNGNGRAG
jgi:pSer/pThr/pTyr-binding forkhead associated (FHA) protein